MPSSRHLPLISILVLTVLCSCSEQEYRLSELAPPSETESAAKSFSREVFLSRRAQLVLEAEGLGSISVAVRREGRPDEHLKHKGLAGDSETIRVPLPAPRSKLEALLLDFHTEREAVIKSIVLETPLPPNPKREDQRDLRGSLSGQNLVIVLADSLHSAHMSCYGYERPTTPHLDALAEQGLRFERAYSQTSWTAPSVVTLFTALDQERHGVNHVDRRLGEDCTSLAELFQRAGYHTQAFVQNGVAGERIGIQRGFDDFRTPGWDIESTARLVRRVERVVREPKEGPLFLYLHLLPPHMPYMPPPEFASQYDPSYHGPVTGSIESIRHVADKPPEDPDVVHLEALYDEYTNWIDAQLGNLIDGLKSDDAWQNTVLLFLSDHGEAFMQHGQVGHNSHIYEEMVRIPVILRAPKGRLGGPQTISEAVSMTDLAPTLIELFGLDDFDHKTVGRSLLPLLEGRGEKAPKPIFLSSRYGEKNVRKLGRDRPRQFGMVLGDYKLVLDSMTEQVELYDTQSDPLEQHDSSLSFPLRTEAMRLSILRWRERALAEGIERSLAAPTELTERDRQEMRNLGYTGD